MEGRYHSMVIMERLPSYNGDTEGEYYICKYSPIGMNHLFEQVLQKYPQITYETEKTYPGLKDKGALRYDFCLHIDGKEILVELDGEQHYNQKTAFSSPKLEERDKKKNEYALTNGIPLYRIPYTRSRRKFNFFLEQLLCNNEDFLSTLRVKNIQHYSKNTKDPKMKFYKKSGNPLFDPTIKKKIDSSPRSEEHTPYLTANEIRLLESILPKIEGLPKNTPIKRSILDQRGLTSRNIQAAKKHGFFTQEGCEHGYHKILV